MNLEHRRISVALIISLIALFFFPLYMPSWHLTFFAPFLVILCYQKGLLVCLWGAAMSGLVIDLLSANTHFGLFAINYAMTMYLIYAQRRHFFADKVSTLPLMTFLFAVFSTIIQIALMYAFEQEIRFSWSWALTDLIYMPMADALYGFVFFILPFLPFTKRQRRGDEYFTKKRFPLYRN